MASNQANSTLEANKVKNEEIIMSNQAHPATPERNIVADGLSQFLMIAIIYGVPVLLMLFGLYFVWGRLQVDLDSGVRSMAAALLPLVVTLAFFKSQIRRTAVNFLSEKHFIAFAFAFAMAMAAASLAQFVRSSGSGIPVGELA